MRTKPLVTFSRSLAEWGHALTLQPEGFDFDPDVGGILNVINVDSGTAFRMASATLEGLLAVKPESLSPQSAEKLCRVLAPLADILRQRGDRNSACDLLDLAFHVERKLNDLGLRAYLFRTASYLLCDLAYLEEAEDFADRSTKLALLAGDPVSLGRSLYVNGVMLDRLGSPDQALPFYRACLLFCSENDEGTRIATRVAMAYCRFELGEVTASLTELEEIVQTLPVKQGRVFARVAMTHAMVASHAGEAKQADHLFDRAAEEFAANGSPEDVALCGLEQLGHLLRFRRFAESRELDRRLRLLAVQLKDNKVGRAILLEVLRRSAQGQLTAQQLKRWILRWREPWRRDRGV